MDNEILKNTIMDYIERCKADIIYYRTDKRERIGYLDNVNYLEGEINGYKEILRLMEKE